MNEKGRGRPPRKASLFGQLRTRSVPNYSSKAALHAGPTVKELAADVRRLERANQRIRQLRIKLALRSMVFETDLAAKGWCVLHAYI